MVKYTTGALLLAAFATANPIDTSEESSSILDPVHSIAARNWVFDAYAAAWGGAMKLVKSQKPAVVNTVPVAVSAPPAAAATSSMVNVLLPLGSTPPAVYVSSAAVSTPLVAVGTSLAAVNTPLAGVNTPPAPGNTFSVANAPPAVNTLIPSINTPPAAVNTAPIVNTPAVASTPPAANTWIPSITTQPAPPPIAITTPTAISAPPQSNPPPAHDSSSLNLAALSKIMPAFWPVLAPKILPVKATPTPASTPTPPPATPTPSPPATTSSPPHVTDPAPIPTPPPGTHHEDPAPTPTDANAARMSQLASKCEEVFNVVLCTNFAPVSLDILGTKLA